jgi:hypothetical protein
MLRQSNKRGLYGPFLFDMEAGESGPDCPVRMSYI